jgi:osmotically-inducible protein OsmY
MMRILTVLSIVLLLVGCSGSNTAETGSADKDLEQAITARLASVPQIQAANITVAASVTRNEAALSGTLPSEELRLRAVELARSAKPGLLIADKIDVKPPELSREQFTDNMASEAREKAKALGNRIGKSLDDAWVYTKIVARLTADPDTSALKVNVDVANGVVTLRGRVESSTAKAEAERIAKDTEGVKAVKNLLTVGVG